MNYSSYRCICGKLLNWLEIKFCRSHKDWFDGNLYCISCQAKYKK